MRRSLFIAAFGLFFTAAAIPAQALTDEVVRAHVPFTFHVLDTTLPPGDYVIQSAGTTDRSLLVLRKEDGRNVMLFLTELAAPEKDLAAPRLVFDRYGQERFLHKILLPGDSGNELLVSAAEHRAALAAAPASDTAHEKQARKASRS